MVLFYIKYVPKINIEMFSAAKVYIFFKFACVKCNIKFF